MNRLSTAFKPGDKVRAKYFAFGAPRGSRPQVQGNAIVIEQPLGGVPAFPETVFYTFVGNGSWYSSDADNVILGWEEPAQPPGITLKKVMASLEADPARALRDAWLAEIFGAPQRDVPEPSPALGLLKRVIRVPRVGDYIVCIATNTRHGIEGSGPEADLSLPRLLLGSDTGGWMQLEQMPYGHLPNGNIWVWPLKDRGSSYEVYELR